MLCVTYILIVSLCSGVSNHYPHLHSPYTVHIGLIENNNYDSFKTVLFNLSKTNTPHLRKKSQNCENLFFLLVEETDFHTEYTLATFDTI